MLSRRSLLKRLGAFVTVVALAPEIAFASKLDVQPSLPPLDLQKFMDAFYTIAKGRSNQPQIDIFTDKAGLDALYAMTGQSVGDRLDFSRFELLGRPVGVYEQIMQFGGSRG